MDETGHNLCIVELHVEELLSDGTDGVALLFVRRSGDAMHKALLFSLRIRCHRTAYGDKAPNAALPAVLSVTLRTSGRF